MDRAFCRRYRDPVWALRLRESYYSLDHGRNRAGG